MASVELLRVAVAADAPVEIARLEGMQADLQEGPCRRPSMVQPAAARISDPVRTDRQTSVHPALDDNLVQYAMEQAAVDRVGETETAALEHVVPEPA
jgi:hypothetical protein